jgi:alpha-galactosidase
VCLFAVALPALTQNAGSSATANSSLVATPPMGWNSWNHFASKVTDADVRAAADALVSSGMKDAGYTYVNIDDTWEGKRDRHGVIHSNEKFPDMKALADYVHVRGLKLGLYSSPGPRTCAGYTGSYRHEKQDAMTYAAWGVDYLKYDMCSYGNIMKKKAGGVDNPAAEPRRLKMDQEAYEKMHQALGASGRAIVLSMCQYGWDDVWKWGKSVGGNLWRTTGDINDTYARMAEIGFAQAGLARYAGAGHWNDPDMLEVGNGGMTADEYRTHMSLWAILAAPLLAGNDLNTMTPETLAILTNREVITIDQDALGRQGDRIYQKGTAEIWSKPLSGRAQAVGIFNRSSEAQQIPLKLSQVGVSEAATLHDIWGASDVTAAEGIYRASVPAHGVVLLRVSP